MDIETSVRLKRGLRYLKLFFLYNSRIKLLNLCLSLLERRFKRIDLRSKPHVLKIEPTNNCNLNCLFCDERIHSTRKKGFMDIQQFKGLIDKFAQTVYLASMHLWGESLLHPQISEMIEYAHKKRMGTILSSNFNFLTEELAENLILSGLDILVVSLDGASQKTYQKYRQNGNFDKVLANIRLIIQKKKDLKRKTPFIELQCLVMKHNENERDEIKKIARNLGVNLVKFAPFYIYEPKYFDWLPSDIKMRFQSYKTRTKIKTKTCWWLWSSLNINWDGTVVPCCLKVFNTNFGNIFNQNANQIWNNQHFKKARGLFLTPPKTSDSVCFNCKQYADTNY